MEIKIIHLTPIQDDSYAFFQPGSALRSRPSQTTPDPRESYQVMICFSYVMAVALFEGDSHS